MSNDVNILRALAEELKLASTDPKQEEKRSLWDSCHSLKKARIPIKVYMGEWDALGSEILTDDALKCKDLFCREAEFKLRRALFNYEVDDDEVIEPWITMGPYFLHKGWGIDSNKVNPENASGAYHIDPIIKCKEDLGRLRIPKHAIDEQKLKISADKIEDAIGDIITIDRGRGNAFISFDGDISSTMGQFLGMEQLMILPYDDSELLEGLAQFLYKGIIGIYDETDTMNDWTLTTWLNLAMPYCRELPRPKPNTPTTSKNIWGFFASQEFTLISPEMQEEFLLKYQLPLMKRFGLISYGCCEDLTGKIKMLRQIPNLRKIAVSPWADVAKCAEQIEDKYVFSWRPNPSINVCSGWDPELIRRTTQEALEKASECIVEILLKDVQTLQGESWRVSEWVKIVREVAERY